MKKLYKDQMERQRSYEKRTRGAYEALEWSEIWDTRHLNEEAEVRDYARSIRAKIVEELGRELRGSLTDSTGKVVADTEDYLVSRVVRTLYGFRKDTSVWVCKVSDGWIVSGGTYPEALGFEIVSDTHYHNLELSPTYSALYRELLQILDEKFGSIHNRDSEAIKQELAGKFVLPVEPEHVKPPPKTKPIEPPAPSFDEILAQARSVLPPEQDFFGAFGVTPGLPT